MFCFREQISDHMTRRSFQAEEWIEIPVKVQIWSHMDSEFKSGQAKL